MKTLFLVVLVLLPLALALPQGSHHKQHGSHGKSHDEDCDHEDGEHQQKGELEKMKEAFFKLFMEGNHESSQEESSEEEEESSEEESSSEQGGKDLVAILNKELREQLQKYMEGKEDKEQEEEKEKKEEFQKWMKYQIWKHEQHEKEEEEERKKKEEEAEKRKVQLMALTHELHEVKIQLVHNVTFQFLELCGSDGFSHMMKEFFEHPLQASGKESSGQGNMGGSTSTGTGNTTVTGNTTTTVFGNTTIVTTNNNSSNTTTITVNNVTIANITTGGSEGEGDGEGNKGGDRDHGDYLREWHSLAEKFSKMSTMEISHDLTEHLVMSMCASAREYMEVVQMFAGFSAKLKKSDD